MENIKKEFVNMCKLNEALYSHINTFKLELKDIVNKKFNKKKNYIFVGIII